MFWRPFENENQTGGCTQKETRKPTLSKFLRKSLELEDKGCKITLKDEQRKAVKQLYGKKDLVAILPTGFGESPIFQLLVLLENRNRNGHTQIASAESALITCPLTSIINGRICEVESMGLSACNLLQKLADLTEVKVGKMFIWGQIFRRWKSGHL